MVTAREIAEMIPEMKNSRGVQKDLRARVIKFFVHFSRTGMVGRSCRAAGMDRRTIDRYRVRYDWFNDLMEDLALDEIEELELAAKTKAYEGDGTMLRWLLAKKDPERYGDNDKLQNIADYLEALSNMSIKETKELISDLQAAQQEDRGGEDDQPLLDQSNENNIE